MGIYDNTVEVPRRSMILFFIVDTSDDMEGIRTDILNQAFAEVIPEIQKLSARNAYADIKIAVLSFANDAKWLTAQPVSADKFCWNDLRTGGNSDFSAMCSALCEKLSEDNFMNDAKGYYAPAIFLISGSTLNDEYRRELEKLWQNKWFSMSIKVAASVGSAADINMLSDFTGESNGVITVHTTQSLNRIIRLISLRAAQIASRSCNVGNGIAGQIKSRQALMLDAIRNGIVSESVQIGTQPAGDDDRQYNWDWW